MSITPGFCANCGTPRPGSAGGFCANCGTALPALDVATPAQSAYTPPPAYNQPPAYAQSPAGYAPVYTPSPAPARSGVSSAALIAGLMVVVLVAVGAFFLLNNSNGGGVAGATPSGVTRPSNAAHTQATVPTPTVVPQTPAPTDTPTPTDTPEPTDTPAPTSTPAPVYDGDVLFGTINPSTYPECTPADPITEVGAKTPVYVTYLFHYFAGSEKFTFIITKNGAAFLKGTITDSSTHNCVGESDDLSKLTGWGPGLYEFTEYRDGVIFGVGDLTVK